MAHRTSDIFSDFDRIRERMDQAYKRLMGPPGAPGFCDPFLEPPVDVYQTDTEVVVLMEMAGIGDEEIELEVEGSSLTIRGRRRPVPGKPGRVYSQMEISHGEFQREITLPSPVDPERAEAAYKDGILQIVMARAQPSNYRQLRIVVR